MVTAGSAPARGPASRITTRVTSAARRITSPHLKEIRHYVREGRCCPAPTAPSLPPEQDPRGQIQRQRRETVRAHMDEREGARRTSHGDSGSPSHQPAKGQTPEEDLLGHRGQRIRADIEGGEETRHGDRPSTRDDKRGDSDRDNQHPARGRRSWGGGERHGDQESDDPHADCDEHGAGNSCGSQQESRAAHHDQEGSHESVRRQSRVHRTTNGNVVRIRGLNGRWSLATNSASKTCGHVVTGTCWSNPAVIETSLPSSLTWMCPSSGTRRVEVSSTSLAPARTRRIWIVDPEIVTPGSGSTMVSVAVDRGRGAGSATRSRRRMYPARSEEHTSPPTMMVRMSRVRAITPPPHSPPLTYAPGHFAGDLPHRQEFLKSAAASSPSPTG